jgi:hypothetical protein
MFQPLLYLKDSQAPVEVGWYSHFPVAHEFVLKDTCAGTQIFNGREIVFQRKSAIQRFFSGDRFMDITSMVGFTWTMEVLLISIIPPYMDTKEDTSVSRNTIMQSLGPCPWKTNRRHYKPIGSENGQAKTNYFSYFLRIIPPFVEAEKVSRFRKKSGTMRLPWSPEWRGRCNRK